jgi:hypothetical protein
MELTEKERLMLVEKKKEIQRLTSDLFDIKDDPKQTKRMKKRITNILSVLSTIGSYVRTKDFDLDVFSTMAESIFADLSGTPWDTTIFADRASDKIEKFCIYANSIQFDFTRKDFRIIIPKIDISIFRAK